MDAVEKHTPEGWTEWNGGERPVDGGAVVDVQFRSAAVAAKGTRLSSPCRADRLAWWHDGEDDDIVAYRIAKATGSASS